MCEKTQNSVIEFQLNSWMENAAICGLVNILGKENITQHPQSIEVPIEKFESFEDKYFQYFAEQYKKLSSLTKILDYRIEMERQEQQDFRDFDQKNYERLQKYLADLKRYGESNSYKAVYPLLKNDFDILEWLKKAKIPKLKKNELTDQREAVIQRVKDLYETLKPIFSYYERSDVQRYLAAKIQIYNVINKGYGDVSFLNRQESKGDFFKQYREYFVDSMIEYLEEDHEKDKLHCTNCGRSVKRGDISFSFINQAGFDANRKQSNVWNFINDLYMCPICRLLYTCIPAGFTYVFNQGLFVNDNHSTETLFRINEGIRINVLKLNHDNVKTTNTYAALIRTLQNQSARQSERELNDIQVVRYENDQYYFNLLPKHILRVIRSSNTQLAGLFNAGYLLAGEYHGVYQEVIQRLFNNTNLFSLLHQTLRIKGTGEQVYIQDYQFIGMIKVNQKFLKELIPNMKILKENELERIRRDGYFLKDGYDNPKKANGIGFRLLNALRANNKNDFMDTLLNSYIYLDKQVPRYFTDVFLEDELFKTIGYTFVTGIIGSNSQEGKGGSENE